MFGLDLESCDYTPIDDNYGTIEYNEIKLYVTKDLEYFCASRLLRYLKYDKPSVISSKCNNWISNTIIPKIKSNWPDLYHKVEGPGTQSYKGWYVHISLINYVGYKIDPERFQHWLMGEPWDNVNMKGYIYLVQPPRCVGTNIVKIGETSNFKKRLTQHDYGRGTIVLATVKTNSRSIAEHYLIKLFQDNGAINRRDYGKEYFEVEDLQFAKILFAKIAITIPEMITGKVLRYRTGSWIHGYENEEED